MEYLNVLAAAAWVVVPWGGLGHGAGQVVDGGGGS